ncbi:peptidoglycan/LPS O-acetylase OafA/YrhL [Neobacillus niacini]|uniref:acyltransferase family protein n=1 Tax=Neobacillus driksii TaxID=3035913 RepID=UPI002787CCED|nr:acyltransferase [Neobacillus niacini]MDQ0975381.1 peptidoglycan/LPS O-acetylase OafA/YrhL [Neobacillus niacini]
MINRYEELDSLRGLAALSVVFGHMYLIYDETILSKLLFEYGPLRATIASNEAVTLFFVLSGFVLSLPFYDKRKFNYGGYLVKRISRIYVPYIFAIFIAFILRGIFYTENIKGLSNWFNINWSFSININTVIDHIILIKTFSSNLNNVVWSLVHEMRISLIFPLIMMIIVRLDYKKGIVFSIGVSIVSVIYFNLLNPLFLGTELYVSLHYCSMFIIGALIAKHREKIINLISNLTIRIKIILFLIGILLFLYAHPSFVLNIIITDFEPFYRTVIDSWFTSIGAGILIIFSVSSLNLARILKNKMIRHIGKISYSLYLSHLPILLSCIHFLNDMLPMWVILCIAIIATIIVSSIMYYFVENSAIKLGKYLTRSHSLVKDKQSKVGIKVKIM